jgi:hypothetical protein
MVPRNGATTYARTTQDGRLSTMPEFKKTLASNSHIECTTLMSPIYIVEAPLLDHYPLTIYRV